MKVTVLGASGRAGSEITRELARRGHAVTGIARQPANIPAVIGVRAVRGNAGELATLADLLRGSDAVISALHFDVMPADALLSALR